MCLHRIVGLSRHPTDDPRRPRRESSSIRGRRSQSIKSGASRPGTSDHANRQSLSVPGHKADTAFSAEDLEAALQRSNLETTKEESGRSGQESRGRASGDMSLEVPLRPRERLISFDDDGP